MNELKTQKTDQKEILVVDDTPTNLQLLTGILTGHGYRVRPSSDGRFALQSVASELPDLILLDVKMPDMDGYEVCRRLKADERSLKIPVIFISAFGETAEKVEGFNAGGVDYITKPFDPEEVLARVGIHLRLWELTERLEENISRRTAELEAAHEELVKRERLSVLGRMTAMVSHELRNPLGVIRSSAYYLNSRLGNADEKTRKHLERIEQQVGHCDSIVDELLEYTRGRRPEMVKGNLDPWLEEVLDQIETPKSVKLIRELSPGLPAARFDGEKLRRVVINLMENAFQAVIERQEGRQEGAGSYQPQVKVGTSMAEDGVCIDVEDNGIGMDEETAARAFEPLFTTKARGSGLGLAIVQKIVEEHGGAVSLKSETNHGTRATMVIPLKSH